MQLRRTTATGALAFALVTVAACTGSKPAAQSPTASPTVAASSSASESPTAVSESPTTSPPTPTPTHVPVVPAVISLSGLPGSAGKRVIAVKIDNTPNGRPQSGLDDADIVYVEEVEGGLTRVMAVFQSRMPRRVGPVRSARESDLEILAAYGKVGLAYAGAQPKVDALVQASPQVAANEDNGNFMSRDYSRYAPYNLYLDPAKLLRARPRIATAHDIGLHFSPKLAGGIPVRSVVASMSYFVTVGFVYDRPHHRWLESMNGAPIFVAGGDRSWTTNIVVQEVSVVASRFHDVNHANTPLTHTVGTGHFRIFRPDGTVFTGTWTRLGKGKATTYRDAKGHEVTVAPGRTWFLLVPKGNHVSVR